MSQADVASGKNAPGQRLVTELKVSGHLMNFDAGLFCIVQTPSKSADRNVGLPGVRISVPPGAASRPEAVTISTFSDDGWLHAFGDAALIRVVGGPAQVLVTIYQAPGGADAAPNLQVLKLIEETGAGVHAAPMVAAQPAPARPAPQPVTANAPRQAPQAAPSGAPEVMDMLAHIQGRGDVGGKFGNWLGNRGSRQWIEGFALAPLRDVPAADLEYQAVLGRGWLSPWVEGGQFCGSRGMALPVLGMRVRLKGASAEKFEIGYAASFVDGAESGPIKDGEPCEAESLAAVEAFFVEIRPRVSAVPAPVKAPARKAEMAKPAVAKAEAAAETATAPGKRPAKKPKKS